MGQIRVHDAHEIPAARPEAIGDGASQTASSVPCEDVQIHCELPPDAVRQDGRSVRGIIIDEDDLEGPLQPRLERLKLAQELLDVLPLVERRDDDG